LPQDTQIGFRIPKGLKKAMRDFVKESGLYMNESEFVREAIRDKLLQFAVRVPNCTQEAKQK